MRNGFELAIERDMVFCFFPFVIVKESHIFEGLDLPKGIFDSNTLLLSSSDVTLLILRPLLLFLNDDIKPPKNAIKITFSTTASNFFTL